MEKMAQGRYWSLQGQDAGFCDRIITEAQVQSFTGIEVLGLAKGEDAIKDCQNCENQPPPPSLLLLSLPFRRAASILMSRTVLDYASLCRQWNYMKISLNSADFAITLGFLVSELEGRAKAKIVFDMYNRLRWGQALHSRQEAPANGFIRCWCVAAASIAATIVTGGLAAPVTIPLAVGSSVAGMGCGVSGVIVGVRDEKMWDQRMEVYESLYGQFPHLRQLIAES
jgi:hypothetical protein